MAHVSPFCRSVMSWNSQLLRTWRRASFGLPFWLSWVVHTRPLNWKNICHGGIWNAKKSWPGLWGKMKSFSYMLYGTICCWWWVIRDLWQKTSCLWRIWWTILIKTYGPNWLKIMSLRPLQAYILGVIERSGGIFGREARFVFVCLKEWFFLQGPSGKNIRFQSFNFKMHRFFCGRCDLSITCSLIKVSTWTCCWDFLWVATWDHCIYTISLRAALDKLNLEWYDFVLPQKVKFERIKMYNIRTKTTCVDFPINYIHYGCFPK